MASLSHSLAGLLRTDHARRPLRRHCSLWTSLIHRSLVHAFDAPKLRHSRGPCRVRGPSQSSGPDARGTSAHPVRRPATKQRGRKTLLVRVFQASILLLFNSYRAGHKARGMFSSFLVTCRPRLAESRFQPHFRDGTNCVRKQLV